MLPGYIDSALTTTSRSTSRQNAVNDGRYDIYTSGSQLVVSVRGHHGAGLRLAKRSTLTAVKLTS